MKQIFGNFSRMVDGFSLVEVVIFLVIVGLSSAIALPICHSNDKKAKMAEADASLGRLRTQLRIYYSKNGEYPKEASAINVVGGAWNDINSGELTGKYFADASYTYESDSGLNFLLTCAGGGVLNSDRTLNQSGHLAGGI